MPETKETISPLVIVGDEDVVLGFKALGFKVYPVRNTANLTNRPIVSNGVDPLKSEGNWGTILEEIVESGAAVCLLQDNFYKSAETELAAYQRLTMPVFIPFAKDGGMSILTEMVKNIRIKATGAY
jgi:vacuolar-type H+-ATPase subunit F/Vma7